MSLWRDLSKKRERFFREHHNRASRIQNVLDNLIQILPEFKEKLQEAFNGRLKRETSEFLDMSFILGWKKVRKGHSLQAQTEAITAKYNDYLEYADCYGQEHLAADDPLSLLKSRLFLKPVSDGPLASGPPRMIVNDNLSRMFEFQSNATVAPILKNAIIDRSGEYAGKLYTMLETLTESTDSSVAATSLPNFYYESNSNNAILLQKEGSVSLKDIALFFDEEWGRIRSKYDYLDIDELQKSYVFIGNVFNIHVKIEEGSFPIKLSLEDFETGDMVTFEVAAVHHGKVVYVKRDKNDWYAITKEIKKLSEEELRAANISGTYKNVFFYRASASSGE